MAAAPVNKSDLRETRFRLSHEDLRDSGSGCLIYHKPTKQSWVSEQEVPYFENKKIAVDQMCKALGTTVEELLRQPKDLAAFPGWETTELYHREYTGITITVFFLREEEDPELRGWTWGLDDNARFDYDPGIYETATGAIRAAEKWADEHLVSSKPGEKDGSANTQSTSSD